MTDSNSHVTWRWIAVTAFGVLALGGGSWMTQMHNRVWAVENDSKENRETTSTIKSDVEVIKERTRRQEEDLKELKENVNKKFEEQNRKLDELLRRVK